MRKKALFFAVLCTAFFSIHASTSKAKKTEQVDAVTQATYHNEFQFTLPFAVTATSVTIIWTEYFADQGKAVLSYGTNKANLTKRDVTVTERTNMSLVLTGLSPNTTYFLKVEASAPDQNPNGDTTTITTLKKSGTIQTFNSAKNIPLELLDHSVRLGSQAKAGDRLTIADCGGRTLFDHSISGNEARINLPSTSKGVYFLTYSRNGKMIDNKRFIIANK